MVSHSDSVLIIGGDSFTGYHLSRYLSNKGYVVASTSRSGTTDDYLFADILNADSLSELFRLTSYDYVINLAAASFVADDDREQFYKVNVLGLENVLEALVRSAKTYKKVIMPSSATVYGPQGLEVLDEDLVPAPVGHYAYSKLIGESVCSTYFDQLNIVVPRPFNYTGVGQDERFLVPKIVNAFKDRASTIKLGNLDTYREYNDVEYVCEVYEKLMTSSFSSEVVNVSSGVAYSAREIISTLEQLSQHKIEVETDPRFVRVNDIPRLVGSCDRLASVCGLALTPQDLHLTLHNMLKAKS